MLHINGDAEQELEITFKYLFGHTMVRLDGAFTYGMTLKL